MIAVESGQRDGVFDTFLRNLKRVQAPQSEGSGIAYPLFEEPRVAECDEWSVGRTNMMWPKVRQCEFRKRRSDECCCIVVKVAVSPGDIPRHNKSRR